MDIELYKTSDGINVINKTLTDKIVVQGNLKVGFNTYSPTILLEAIDGVSIDEYNYLIIPSLARNYIVEQVESIAYKVYRFWCSVDVLETYKEDILNSHCRFMRKIQEGDYYDGNVDSNVKFETTTYVSNGGFPEGTSLIMTTVGMTS